MQQIRRWLRAPDAILFRKLLRNHAALRQAQIGELAEKLDDSPHLSDEIKVKAEEMRLYRRMNDLLDSILNDDFEFMELEVRVQPEDIDMRKS